MTTVHISIGNSDGKLSHAEWADFFGLTDELLTGSITSAIYGVWHSLPTAKYVNACWAVEVPDDQVARLKALLGELAWRYRQDSIAWLEGKTEFIRPPRTDRGEKKQGDERCSCGGIHGDGSAHGPAYCGGRRT